MRVLFIGLGSIGQRHLRNLRTLKGDAIDIIAWRVRGLNRVVTDEMQTEDGADLTSRYDYREVPTLEAGLAEQPDCTFLCNPTSMHVPIALAALRAGSHVFIEKPLSNSMAEVDTLIVEASRRKLVGYVGHQFRFHPTIQHLEKLLACGAIGPPLAVRAVVGEYLPNFHTYEDYRHTYAARRELGGGVVLTQSHEIDYLCHLFGIPRRVFAVGGHLSTLQVNVEDLTMLIMDCGTHARPLPVALLMDFVQQPSARNCEVIGEDGKIAIDLTLPSLVQFGRNGSETYRQHWRHFRRNDMFVDQLKHFLACCAGEEDPRSTLLDGARSLKVALAILRSIENRSVEEVIT
jgi:predicted dehydrogenase